MYITITEEDKQKELKDFDYSKITPETLGLRATNDFAQFANEKIVSEMPIESQQWVSKGPIGVLEAGQMYADEMNEFDGTYVNLETSETRRERFQQEHPKIGASRAKTVDERIAENFAKKEERNKRVNEGTATFFDRVGAFMDKVSNDSLKAQKEQTQKVQDRLMPNKDNVDYRYEFKSIDRAGQPVYVEKNLAEKIGFIEGLHESFMSGQILPFAKGHIKRAYDKRILNIKEKIKNNEYITQEELNIFNKYREKEYEKQIRGYSIGGQIGENWLPNMLAFGGEIAVGGWILKSLGLAGKGIAVGSNLAKTLLKSGKVNKAIAGALGFTTGQIAEGSLNALVGGSVAGVAGAEFWANYNERKLNDTMKITDRGTVVFREASETPAKAFIKSMASVYFSYFAESMGGLLGAPLKVGSKIVGNTSAKAFEQVLKNCPKLEGFIKKSAPLLAKAYEKLNNLPIKGKSAEWLKNQVKFDGFLEEIGEELLEDVLNLSTGINNEERSLENYIKIFHKTPEEWAVLTGMIALQGTTLSLAGNLVGHIMQNNGVEDEKILETLSNTSEAERLEIIGEAIENGSLNVSEIKDEYSIEQVEEQVKNTYLASNKNLDEDTIDKVARVTSVLASSLARKQNKNIDEIQDILPMVEQVNQYMYADESGKGYTQDEINEVLDLAQNELMTLPENFSDEVYINNLNEDIRILQDMANGKLDEADSARAWDILNRNVQRKEIIRAKDYNLKNQYLNFQYQDEGNTAYGHYYKVEALDNSGNIIGDISYMHFPKMNVVQISDQFVKPEYQRQGIATDLIEIIKSKTGTNKINGNILTNDGEKLLSALEEKGVIERYDFKDNKGKNLLLEQREDLGLLQQPDLQSKSTIELRTNKNKYLTDNEVEQVKIDSENFKNRINDFLNKKISPKSRITVLSALPSAYNRIPDLKGKKVIINQSIYSKIIDLPNKHKKNHNIDRKRALKLPELLADPLYILQSSSKGNEHRYVVVTSSKNNKPQERLSIILNPSNNVAIVSAYDEAININEEKKAKRVLYDKKKELSKTFATSKDAMMDSPKKSITNFQTDFKGDVKQHEVKNRFYQSAYHGTPHKFDEFSLDAIGTGEGAQAHGWGLYFAGDKNISEEYRRKLTSQRNFVSTKSLDEQINNILINGNPLLETYNIDVEKSILNVFSGMNVDSIINQLNFKIKNWESTLNEPTYPYKKYAQEKIAEYNRLKKDIENNAKIDFANTGQLYEVDIPENDVLLDEDKVISEQPEVIKKAFEFEQNALKEKLCTNQVIFKALTNNNDISIQGLYQTKYWNEAFEKFRNNPEKYIDKYYLASKITGKKLYNDIAHRLGSQKAASEKLNELGIKGITYDGRQDGRCYVIFDDKAVKVLNTFYQGVEPEQQNIFLGNREAKKIHKVKGGYLPAEKFIELFQNADASTIVHECAHWYLDELTRIAKYNEEVAEDLEAVRRFLKNEGEDFTRAQHEKFARSFEAYILTGSSRNNKIKKVFEDFKNWLLQIYDEIKNLQISVKEMPEITNLFDRLLTSEKQRSAAVFNKLSAIDEQIANIVEKQEQELDELDEIYKTNIQENNRKSDTKRKIDEYLELASKAAKREPKEVREFKQRYKEATFQILEAATGYNRTFIAQKRNAQKVEEAINNVEDKITISGGMRPEWEEFYADTGVGYDTDEVGGDYELASQAWQVFQEGTYKIDDSEYSDIEEFAGQFDYLYGKALSLQGEERFVALEALYTLWGNMPALPNEYLQDLMSKVQELEQGIEEAEREAFNRKNFANIPVVEHLQWFITDKIKNLKVYNPETKHRMRLDKSHRLYRFIKGATSINKAKVIVRKINEFVIEDLRNQQRAILHKEIQKQVRINSKVVKTGNTAKGKFDWKTNTVFAELQELNKLSKNEALNRYDEIAKMSEIEISQTRDGWDEKQTKFDEFKNDFDFNLKRNFIEYKSQTGRLEENAKGQRVSNLNIQLGTKILEDIIKLKEIGREAKSEEEIKKKLNKRSYRNNFVQLIREKGQKPWVRKFVTHLLHSGQPLANWETTLNAVFGSEVSQELSLLEDEADIDSYKRRIANKLFNRIRRIYNMGKANAFEMALDYDNVQQIIDLFQSFDNEKYTILETSFDINTGEFFRTNVELTKNQIITLYGWYQNDNLKRRLETQYGAGELLTLFDNALSDKEKELVWAVIDTLQEMYPDVNEVFINETGLSLPQEQNYIPSVTERIVSDLDMLHDCIMASKSPSATKRRKTSNRIKMNPSSLMEIVLPHIDKMSRYVILQEKLNFYRAIFNNANITAVFREVYGKKDGEALHREIKNQLEEFSFGSTNGRMGKLKEFADGVAKNFIVGSIGGSPKVALGQLTSMINYSENMPAGEWGIGFTKSLASPVDTFKFMMQNSEYLQARLAGNTQNEIIATLTNEADKFRKVTNFFTLNVKWGDIIAITLGGKPYVDYLVSQGMSLEEAIKKFEAETMRAQQASTASSTSRWQKKQTETALGRMFWAFRTVEFQFERKVYDAILKGARGEITPNQAIKTIMIYRVVNPVIFSVLLQQFAIAPLLRMLFGDDDDPAETWKGLGISGALAVLTANLSHWGYFGIGASFIIQTALKYLSKDKKMKAFKTQVPFISDIEDATTKLFKKGGPDTADWVNAIAVGVKYGFGVPADKIVNFGEGVQDIAQGRTGIGLLRVGGWGEYAATEAMTGEAPKKKRKYARKDK